MKRVISLGAFVLFSLALVGCIATVKWRAMVETSPSRFNQVLINDSGNAVHTYVRDSLLHVSTYDEKGVLLTTYTDEHNVSASSKTLNLDSGRLLIIGTTLNSSLIVDTDTSLVTPIDENLLPEGAGSWTLTGITQVFSSQVAAYGARDVDGTPQAWVILWDVANNTFTLTDIPALNTVNALFSHEHLILQGTLASERWAVTLDAAMSELGRFVIPTENEILIGDSLGRPTFFDNKTKNVVVRAADGTTVWQFTNTEYSHIRGESVGPDGSVLLWGDNGNYSIFSFRTDNAHFLRLTPDGALAYHYLAGNADMAKIDYQNIKQFGDGSIQLSVQGLGGELAGLLFFDGVLGIPYRITKEIQHDFLSAAGKKTRWMREPIRVEVLSRTGPLLIELVSQSGGHCNNRDVFNIGSRHLVTASELCGANTPTVVISYY